MKKEKLLFEIVVSRQCNKRCPYCDLDFSSDFITEEVIDHTINYFSSISQEIESLSVNFFGGEPILAMDKIEYFVSRLQENNITANLSIGTNGVLLDQTKLNFLKNNNFHIYLSIDTETGLDILQKDIFGWFQDMCEINFILNPNTLFLSYWLLQEVLQKWFKNINLMPVFWTISWGTEHLKELKRFIKQCRRMDSDIRFEYYSYFNDVSIEKQFMVEVDGELYSDLDSLLWIQRQNHGLVPDALITEIYSKTHIWNIKNIASLEALLGKYSIKDVLKLVFSIPKVQWNSEKYGIIDIIMKNV